MPHQNPFRSALRSLRDDGSRLRQMGDGKGPMEDLDGTALSELTPYAEVGNKDSDITIMRFRNGGSDDDFMGELDDMMPLSNEDDDEDEY
jgi:hypothetical protein